MRTIKCLVVGDSLVGKSCLLIAYKFNVFAEDHIPKLCEDYSMEVTVKGKQLNLSLCDTADNEDYEGLRLDSYSGSDVILLCFSVLDPESFTNISSKWHPELQQHSPNTPIILLGTKADLREDEFSVEKLKIFKKAEPITYKQGMAMAKEIKAVKYLECSAFTHKGIQKVFEKAIQTATKPKTSGCFIN